MFIAKCCVHRDIHLTFSLTHHGLLLRRKIQSMAPSWVEKPPLKEVFMHNMEVAVVQKSTFYPCRHGNASIITVNSPFHTKNLKYLKSNQ